MSKARDHGGGLDAAISCFGGHRDEWLDLSTGINPEHYPIGPLPDHSWTALPDTAAFERLERAARRFWNVPDTCAVLPTPGASAAIAQIPAALEGGEVAIKEPTYNEHRAAFEAAGWTLSDKADTTVVVHPNNPDGRLWQMSALQSQTVIIDESFCDICPKKSFINHADRSGRLIIKSFGKFWGLAGLRLGFVIGDPDLVARLKNRLGPWQASGPALEIGARALEDPTWAAKTRKRLSQDAARLDALLATAGATPLGGTDLFRLYDTDDATQWQAKLARHKIWSRIFPYSGTWLRLGLPPSGGWSQLEAAL